MEQPQSKSVIDNYEQAVIDLLEKKAFYAKVIMSMKKDFNFPHPTAGVSLKSTGVTLHINPQFFNGLTRDGRVGILIHECLHIMHNHSARFGGFKTQDRGLANIACDLAINQYIPNIPLKFDIVDAEGNVRTGEPVTYEAVLKEIPDLLPRESSEYYFEKLKKLQQDNKSKGKGDPDYELSDDHGEWDDSDLTPEQQEQFVKKHVKAIYDSCSEKEKQSVDQQLIDRLTASDINWKSQLKSFLANSDEIFNESTRRKLNRRYGIRQPGQRTDCKLNLVVAVDTSGSMSDESLNVIFSEIDRMVNDLTIIHVIEADNQIHRVYQYKKGMKITAYGRGGTAYQPAFDKAKELRADALIYCGDMDAFDVPEKPKFQVLWAIVGKQEPPAPFGRKLYLP